MGMKEEDEEEEEEEKEEEEEEGEENDEKGINQHVTWKKHKLVNERRKQRNKKEEDEKNWNWNNNKRERIDYRRNGNVLSIGFSIIPILYLYEVYTIIVWFILSFFFSWLNE